ncbi:unnamed protein product, partial [Coregonus sp. 'balchen']
MLGMFLIQGSPVDMLEKPSMDEEGSRLEPQLSAHHISCSRLTQMDDACPRSRSFLFPVKHHCSILYDMAIQGLTQKADIPSLQHSSSSAASHALMVSNILKSVELSELHPAQTGSVGVSAQTIEDRLTILIGLDRKLSKYNI